MEQSVAPAPLNQNIVDSARGVRCGKLLPAQVGAKNKYAASRCMMVSKST
jgi:hypothetical protein